MGVTSTLTRLFLALILGAVLTGCGFFAELTAPKKKASTVRSAAALQADALFWGMLHAGDYAKIPEGLNALTAAYLEDPADAKTAAHIGWLHIWRLSERARLDPIPATITDDAVLARKYFQEAVSLDSKDARYLGFLAGVTLAEGNVHHDEKLTRQGYFMLKRSIAAWPEFNLFTGGYVMSQLPVDSDQFREALKWQWGTLDACVGGRVDRQDPDFKKYMGLETREGAKRVCWNSWIAPHNVEGFFLNMGDMLVKSGDWKTARRIYANARLSADYERWKYRDVLEERIQKAADNVAAFNLPAPKNGRPASAMMIGATFSCVACHEN